MKFKGDGFDENQNNAYKDSFTGVPLALIRVPEDCKCDKEEVEKNKKDDKNKPNEKQSDEASRRRAQSVSASLTSFE